MIIKGFVKIIHKILNRVRMELILVYLRLTHAGASFRYQGKNLPYYYHTFNETWSTERAVEIPIFLDLVAGYQGKRILEVGNVLNNYQAFPHDVLDKYEKSAGVMNEDVTTFKSGDKYDLILSISTMEHVGWDEPKKDPQKIIKAIDNLRKSLRPGGEIVISFPPGYNTYLDEMLREKKLPARRIEYLVRTGYDKWVSSDLATVIKKRYNDPYPRGNGLFVAYFS